MHQDASESIPMTLQSAIQIFTEWCTHCCSTLPTKFGDCSKAYLQLWASLATDPDNSRYYNTSCLTKVRSRPIFWGARGGFYYCLSGILFKHLFLQYFWMLYMLSCHQFPQEGTNHSFVTWLNGDGRPSTWLMHQVMFVLHRAYAELI